MNPTGPEGVIAEAYAKDAAAAAEEIQAALGQGYAMSCVVGNTHLPFGST